MTKSLAAVLPPIEIGWIRYTVFLCLAVPAVVATGGKALFRTKRPGLQALRSLGMVGSTVLFTQGLRYLPVAESTAIYFISPIVIMALSILFLEETVGRRRLSDSSAFWLSSALGRMRSKPRRCYPCLGRQAGRPQAW